MKKPVLLLLAVCVAALSHGTLTNTVLFDREIVRILNTHCVMCHAEKGPAFPLETYEQTWLQMRPIYADVIARHMPPWPAVPGYGQLANDNGLTLRENQFIVSWVEGLGPRNAGAVFTNTAGAGAAPGEVRAHTDFGQWQLGQPQLTLPLSANTIEPVKGKETGGNEMSGNEIKHTAIDPGLTSERWLRALEYMPGDRRVVRAAFFTIQETGQWIGSWTPWYGFVNLPKGAAIRLLAGSHVMAEIHYRGAKERVIDRGNLGLSFAAAAPPDPVSDVVLEAKAEVPAGASAQKLRAVTRLTAETHVLALRSETMAGLKSIEVSARKPDGGTEVMLFAKDFQTDWPTPYIYKEPVVLPSGTDLSVIAYFTNAGATPQAGGIRLTASVYRKAGTR
jgi:hypothetical protein